MIPKRGRKLFSFVPLTAVFLYLACPFTSWGQERVTMKATWVFTASMAPVFLGIEEGFFKAEGIDLDFQDGRGSRNNLQLLSTQKLLITFVDIGTAAQSVSQGIPVKAVYGYSQLSPMAIVAHENRGIRSPKDLEGKKVGRAPASADAALFPAVVKRNGMDVSKINFVNVTPAALLTALLSQDVDAILNHFPDSVAVLSAQGAKVNFLRYADFGVNTLGKGIVARNAYLAEKPAVVRGLLRAMSKSIQHSEARPDKAISALQKAAPLTVKNPKVAREVLDGYLALTHTKNSQGKPVGWMSEKDWRDTLDIMTEDGSLKNPLPPENYYTNGFIAANPG